MKKLFTILPVITLCTVSALLVQTASALAVTQADSKKATTKITLTVPKGAKAVTYTVNGVQFKIKPGQKVTLPSNATNIGMPKGVVISAVTTRPDGSSATTVMTTTSALQLSNFAPATIKSSSSALAAISVDVVRADGSKILVDVAAGTVVETSASGEVKTTSVSTNPDGDTVIVVETVATPGAAPTISTTVVDSDTVVVDAIADALAAAFTELQEQAQDTAESDGN